MASITVDTRDFEKLHAELEKFRKTALPYAQRDALNGCAFELRKQWQTEIKGAFVIRSPFTERSIRVEKATGLDTRSMKSVTGSVASYMGDQEEGATVHGSGAHKPIPGAYAGGGKPGGGVRPAVVRSAFRLHGISVQHFDRKGYGRRRQNAVAIAVAIRKGERFALLNRARGGGKGIFEVRGLKRRASVKLVWDFSRGSVRIKPEPTMHRAAAVCAPRFQRITENALLTQLKRAKVMGY
jgi:hypothetical protein